MSLIWNSFSIIKNGGSLQNEKEKVHRRICEFTTTPFGDPGNPHWLSDVLEDEDPSYVMQLFTSPRFRCRDCDESAKLRGCCPVRLSKDTREITEDLLFKHLIKKCRKCKKPTFAGYSPLMVFEITDRSNYAVKYPKVIKYEGRKYFIYGIINSTTRGGDHFTAFISFDGSWFKYDDYQHDGVAQGFRIPHKIVFPTTLIYISHDMAGKLTRMDKTNKNSGIEQKLMMINSQLNYEDDDWPMVDSPIRDGNGILQWHDLLPVVQKELPDQIMRLELPNSELNYQTSSTRQPYIAEENNGALIEMTSKNEYSDFDVYEPAVEMKFNNDDCSTVSEASTESRRHSIESASEQAYFFDDGRVNRSPEQRVNRHRTKYPFDETFEPVIEYESVRMFGI